MSRIPMDEGDCETVEPTLSEKNKKLLAENQRLREALEVYADEKNWKEYELGLILLFDYKDIYEGYEPAQKALEEKHD